MSWRDGAGKCQPSEQTLALMDKKNAEARNAVIEECKTVIGNMRQSEAGLLDAKHSGQRGCDRSDALYDAYQALVALSQVPATWAVGNWTPEAIERMRQLSKPATDGAAVSRPKLGGAT